MKTRTLLMIEDDRLQAEEWRDIVAATFDYVETVIVRTRQELEHMLSSIEANPPVCAICDLMLPETEPQTEVLSGITCIKLLRKSQTLSSLPIIVLSGALRYTRFQPDVEALGKDIQILHKPIEAEVLVEILRGILSAQNALFVRQKSFTRRLMDAVDAKPEFGGVSLDVKKLSKKKR